VSLKLCIKVCRALPNQTRQLSSQTMLLTYVRELHDSNLFQDTENADMFCCFTQVLRTDARSARHTFKQVPKQCKFTEGANSFDSKLPVQFLERHSLQTRSNTPSSTNKLHSTYYLPLSKISLKTIKRNFTQYF
jgi:hypothetical protein